MHEGHHRQAPHRRIARLTVMLIVLAAVGVALTSATFVWADVLR